MANSQALNSLLGSYIHFCLDISQGGATGLWTSCGFFCYMILSLCSFANHSLLDGSSHALMNPCGCCQFQGHRLKCTSWHLHLIEGSWHFNQSVPRRMLSFPKLVMNIWICSVCILPCQSWTVRFASKPDRMRPTLLIILSTFQMWME